MNERPLVTIKIINAVRSADISEQFVKREVTFVASNDMYRMLPIQIQSPVTLRQEFLSRLTSDFLSNLFFNMESARGSLV